MVFGKSLFWRSESNMMECQMDFEWQTFPGCTTLGILEDIQNFMIESQCETWAVRQEGSSSCQCTTTLYGRERGNTANMWDEFCCSFELCLQIPAPTLVIFGTWIREEMVRDLILINQMENGDHTNCGTNAGSTLLREYATQYIRATSFLERGDLRSKEKGIQIYSLQREWTDQFELIVRKGQFLSFSSVSSVQ